MNRLSQKFKSLRKTKKKALIAYLSAGYPSLKFQTQLILAMEKAGVDIIELGIPFSDPIADGPTIQMASQKSLERGTNLDEILKWVRKIRNKVSIPIVFMSYLNPIYTMGYKKFSQKANRVGVDGLIVPDMIPEEGAELKQVLKRNSIPLIYLVAPTSPQQRQKQILRQTSGFLYAVSVRGVTGARKQLPPETKAWLAKLKRKSKAPVCVGFGISGQKQIRQLRSSVDGFIVGSALINIIQKSNKRNMQKRVYNFMKTLSKECQNGK